MKRAVLHEAIIIVTALLILFNAPIGLMAQLARADVWLPAPPMSTARYLSPATLLSNGRVLVAGGSNNSSALLSAEIYNPATNSWSAASSMSTARYGHTATLLSNGQVLITGGDDGSSSLSSAEIYNPTTNSWSAAFSMSTARYGHTATLLTNGQVLITGGDDGSSSLASAEIYNPATNSWLAVPSMSAARYEHMATLLSNGQVLITGGENGNTAVSSAEVYNPTTNSWSVIPSMNTARYGHTAILLSDGQVLITGGDNGSSSLSSAEIYNPATNSWSSASSMGTARYGHTAILLSDGQVLITGGENGSAAVASAEIYNSATNGWSPAGPMDSSRAYYSATHLSDGSVLVAGGFNESGAEASAEIFWSLTDQTITFDAVSDKTFGDPPFSVSATASSRLTVGFSSIGSCSVSGNLVTLIQDGNCTITASQLGNIFFNPAPPLSRNFTIIKARTAITNGNSTTTTNNTLGCTGTSCTNSQGSSNVAATSNDTPQVRASDSANSTDPSFTDTTVADFTAGTLDANTYIAQTSDGEVILAPKVGSEFSSAALPSDWFSSPYGTGGNASVSGGSLISDGALVGTNAFFGPGRSLEFVATFSAANQHIGFGVTFSSAPWAIFSTKSAGDGLYTRTNNGSSVIDTLISGNWFGTPHRYRIDWNVPNVVYWIDGVQVATHTVAVTDNMRPLISDFIIGSGSLAVDWIRMTPYAAAGTFLSRIFDAGASVSWGNATWTSGTPAGTTLAISVRQGNTSTPDSSWTSFTALSGSGAAISGSSRYIQYQAVLASTDPRQTPVLNDITLNYTFDTTPPDTNITAGPTGTINTGSADFSWTGSDNVTATGNLVYAYRLDPIESGFSAFGAATTKSYTNLANGNYTFFVKAKDERGNEDPTPAGRSFTVQGQLTYELLHGFSFIGWANRLLQAADGKFYGTTQTGGDHGYGTVFKMDGAGNITVLHSFNGNDGASPYAGLIQGKDGYFYGTTAGEYGTASQYGTVFKIDSTGNFSVLHLFNGSDGATPYASLVQGSDGYFYGTTYGTASAGGQYVSNVFKIDSTGNFSVLHSGFGGYAGLIQASDGYFYGTTEVSIFKMDSSGNLTVLHVSDDPRIQTDAGLVQGSDGNFYGTTYVGGQFDHGTVFKMDSSSNITVLHSFNSSRPFAGLVLGSDGNFYGTTRVGYYPSGTVFKMDGSGNVTTLHSFDGSDGATPFADLIQGTDGNFYGTTYDGSLPFDLGTAGLDGRWPVSPGKIFKVSSTGVFAELVSFVAEPKTPTAGLIQAADGNFYGTTHAGGQFVNTDPSSLNPVSSSGGTVFKMDSDGNLTVLHAFKFDSTSHEGIGPYAGLIQGSDGNFYGTTQQGGTSGCFFSGCGTAFKMDSSGSVAFFPLSSGVVGAIPYAGLVQGSDGSFYGTTFGDRNSPSFNGTVFKVDGSGNFTLLHSLQSFQHSSGSLIEAGGNFYGTTLNSGSVFKVDPLDNFTTLHSFTPEEGSYSNAGLIQGSDGNFYGTGGGSFSPNSFGTVFKMDASGNVTVLHSFNGSDGSRPFAGLIQASDGNFYGTTSSGGQFGSGTAFKIDAAGNFTLLFSFSAHDGASPVSNLIQTADGRFYGTTQFGGPRGGGVVFRITLPGQSDNTPPDTNITAGPTGTITVNSADFTWSGSDNVTPTGSLVYAYRLDPIEPNFSAFGAATSKSYTGLGNGSYTFYVKAKDQAGNEDLSPASRAFTVNVAVTDNTPPDTNITAGPTGTITVSNADFTWSGSDNVTPTASLVYAYRLDPIEPNLSAFGAATSKSYTNLANGSYTFYVKAKDQAGNEDLTPASQSFTVSVTTVASFTDTTVADFSAGTPDGNTYISQTANGEITLAPTVGAEFYGTALPAGWFSSPYGAGGNASVSGGLLISDGALVGTNPNAFFGPGRSLEFVATFSAANQHIGFGVTFSGAPWAIFSTKSAGDGLYVRTNNGTAIDTLIPGNWFGTPHRYRIDWNVSNVVYWIDGVQVATHTVAITDNMRPLISDFIIGGANLPVDWMRMSPYAASTTFLSRVFDAGASASWGTATWASDTPAGTSLVISVRQGNTSTPDNSWTAFTPLSGSGAAISGTSRYLQYRSQLTATVSGQTPALNNITITAGGGGGADNTPPDTNITAGPSGTITVSNADFTWSGSDNVTPTASLVYAYRLDPIEPNFSAFGAATSKSYTNLGNGSYTFYVKAKDQAGNEDLSPASRAFTVNVAVTDTTPPDANITAGPTGTITVSNADFTWSGSDNVTPTASLVYAYRLDPIEANFSAFGAATSKSYTNLANGSYTFYVKAKDQAGNEDLTPASRSFTVNVTTVASFTDTTVADFSAGTPDINTYISQIADGEVILAPTVGSEFSGAALPAGWFSSPYGTGGNASVSGGSLISDGALVGTNAFFGPGRSLEFVATFSAANQHIGFGVTFSSAPWAIFSTKSAGDGLYARTNNGSSVIDTLISGNWFGAPHRYRIDWNVSNVVYWIDGVQVATHTLAISGNMRPLISDFIIGGANLPMDWMRMTPYAASGTFLSRIFDAGGTVSWGNIGWTSDTPPGTSLVINVRQGNTPTPDSSWTPFTQLSGSGAAIPTTSRYLQYQAVLTSADPRQTPALNDLTITNGPFASLVLGVNEIGAAGFPSAVMPESDAWEPIVAGDDDTSPPPTVFVLARQYGAGRVVAIGHEAMLTTAAIQKLDNGQFMENVIHWLDPARTRQVLYTTGHDEGINGVSLQGLASLLGEQYTFTSVAAPVTAAQLPPGSVLIVGHAQTNFTPAEIETIRQFVANGGGLVLAAQGWSWGGPLDEFPMNVLGTPFDVQWLHANLSDPTDNDAGQVIFHLFYPDPRILTQTFAGAMQVIEDAHAAHPFDLMTALESDASLRGDMVLAHNTLATVRNLPADHVWRQEVYDFYLGLMQTFPELYARLEPMDQALYPTSVWFRERVWRTLRDCLALTPELKNQIAAVGLLKDRYYDIWQAFDVILMDNLKLDTAQLEFIYQYLTLVPKELHNLRAMSVTDFLNLKAHPIGLSDEGDPGAANIFGVPIGPGGYSENSFPDDVPPGIVDGFSVVVAHESNHVVNAYTIGGSPELSARHNQLIQEAGTDPENYLRSMLGVGFFFNNPQEFFASIANQWFTDSKKTIDLGVVRFQNGRKDPINQALFFAEVYSEGGATTFFYTIDTSGNITRKTVPLTRDASGHINSLQIDSQIYTFTLDATGNVLAITIGGQSPSAFRLTSIP